MILNINEDVERFKNMTNASLINKDSKTSANSRRQIKSYESGNSIESLARTNPEAFNVAKLEQLQKSTNIVKDFNEYYDDMMGYILNIRSRDPIASKDMMTSTDLNYTRQNYNISITGSMKDEIYDLQKQGFSKEEINQMIKNKWCPEALTEQGCRDLIKAVLKNNRALTNSLTKMLNSNYNALGISSAEASVLIDELNNSGTNNKAIGEIKKFLQDPKKLEKFKIGKSNYDFRSIGGGVIFLSNDDSIKFVTHPSKHLSLIFKYDAIISAHGAEHTNLNAHRAIEIHKGIKSEYEYQNDAYKNFILAIDKYVDDNKIGSDEDLERFNHIIDCRNQIYDIHKDISRGDHKNYDIDKVKQCLGYVQDISNAVDTMNYKYDHEDNLNRSLNIFRGRYIHVLKLQKSVDDPKQAIHDGKSTEWIIQPIDTLKSSNNVIMVDLLRNLKAEGFKNVFISVCNPGNVRLPRDIRNDKEFHIHMGTASVLMESADTYEDVIINELAKTEAYLDEFSKVIGSEYRYLTLNELYDVMNEQYQTIDIIKEGALDSIKQFAKKAIQIVVEIWKRIIGFFKNIYTKINGFIKSKFGNNSNAKLSKPVEINLIEMKNGKANIVKATATTPEEILNKTLQANKTISNYIQKQSNDETNYIRTLNQKLESGRFVSNNNNSINHESFSIFDSINFI